MNESILELLDNAYQGIWSRCVGEKRNVQFAYYNGLKDMAEHVTHGRVVISMNGKHSIEWGEKFVECEFGQS